MIDKEQDLWADNKFKLEYSYKQLEHCYRCYLSICGVCEDFVDKYKSRIPKSCDLIINGNGEQLGFMRFSNNWGKKHAFDVFIAYHEILTKEINSEIKQFWIDTGVY